MTQEELTKRIEAIEHECMMKQLSVYRDYVRENAKYKIGDIVSDGTDTIRVSCVSYTLNGNIPSIFYYGRRLKKNGEPFKDGSKVAVFERGIKQ